MSLNKQAILNFIESQGAAIGAVFGVFLVFGSLTYAPGNQSGATAGRGLPGARSKKFFQSFSIPYRRFAGQDSHEQLRRSPAESGPVCLADRILDLTTIRAEIQQMEAALIKGKEPIRTSWKGVNLARMPVTQAELLYKHGQWIQLSDSDAQRCQDLRCMLGQIYGTASGEEADRIYHWYLKTGYPLALTRTLPFLEQIEVPLSEFLFRTEELRAFNLLSAMLPSSYQKMWTLNTLHRVPNGWGIGDSIAGDYHSKISAELKSRYNPATRTWDYYEAKWGADIALIRLVADNMVLSRVASPSRDFFFELVTHEMSHAIDYFIGKNKIQTYARISEDPEWTSLTRWRNASYIDTDGRKKRRWEYTKDDGEGFATWYASWSPTEDFAESAHTYRFKPHLLKAMPGKWALLRDKVFRGRAYDPASIARFFESETKAFAAPKASLGVADCLAGKLNPPGARVPPVLSAATTSQLSPELAACVNQKTASAIASGIRMLKETEFEACSFFTAPAEQALTRKIASQLEPELSRLISQNAVTARMNERMRQLRADLMQKVDPRDVFLICGDEEQPRSCFESRLSIEVEKVIAPYRSDLQSWADSEAAIFISQADFESVKDRTEKDTAILMIGVQPKLEASADQLWKSCTSINASNPGPRGELLTQPFTGGTLYVDARILNCVNRTLRAVLEKTIAKHLSLVPGQDDFFIAYVAAKQERNYVAFLEQRVAPASSEERKTWETHHEHIVLQLFQELLGEQNTWSVADGASPKQVCRERARARFDALYQKNFSGAPLPQNFSSLEQYRANWSQEACDGLEKQWIEATKTLNAATSRIDLTSFKVDWISEISTEEELASEYDRRARGLFEASAAYQESIRSLPKAVVEEAFEKWKAKTWQTLGERPVRCLLGACVGEPAVEISQSSEKTPRVGTLDQILVSGSARLRFATAPSVKWVRLPDLLRLIKANCLEEVCTGAQVAIDEAPYVYKGRVEAIYLRAADQSVWRFRYKLSSVWIPSRQKWVPLTDTYWSQTIPDLISQ